MLFRGWSPWPLVQGTSEKPCGAQAWTQGLQPALSVTALATELKYCIFWELGGMLWNRFHRRYTIGSIRIQAGPEPRTKAPNSSTLAWRIPWTEEPGRLQSMALLSRTLSDFTFTFPFHALEKEMATHSSVLAWRLPETEETGGLPSMGSHRVRHDWSDLAAAEPRSHCLKGEKARLKVCWSMNLVDY